MAGWLQRERVLGAMLCAPALALAAWLSIVEATPFGQQASRYDEPPQGNLAEAIQRQGVEQAYAFIRAGHDPNAPIAFSDRDLTGDQPMRLSPLLVAIAANQENAVLMLMSFGARLDHPGNRDALCLARYLKRDDIIRVLERDGGTAVPGTCAAKPAPDGRPALRVFFD
jgi:hypothetical protein